MDMLISHNRMMIITIQIPIVMLTIQSIVKYVNNNNNTNNYVDRHHEIWFFIAQFIHSFDNNQHTYTHKRRNWKIMLLSIERWWRCSCIFTFGIWRDGREQDKLIFMLHNIQNSISRSQKEGKKWNDGKTRIF